MNPKVFESELKILEILWNSGDMPAARIADEAQKLFGWSTTTTYTVIKKCVDKGVIERRAPKFICHPKLKQQDIQLYETEELVNRYYAGKADQLIAMLVEKHRFTKDEIMGLEQMIEKLREEY